MSVERVYEHPASLPANAADGEDDGFEPREITIQVPPGFLLDDGTLLPDTRFKCSLYGARNAPVIAVAGGISATRRLCGNKGWWGSTVAPGGGVDLNHYAALGFDFAPSSDVRIVMSPRTQARLVDVVLDRLEIDRLHAYVGASYGGMVGLAFAAHAPRRIERLCVISAAHRPSPMGIAWRGVQRRTVEFAIAQGKPAEGLSLARQLAMTTYRSAAEFEQRFHCLLGNDGQSDLDRYLIARGTAYADAVNAKRWLSLSEAIDRHCVAPEAIKAKTTLVACPTDQLAPFADMVELARGLPNCQALHRLNSIYGHDAFLKEPRRLNAILQSAIGDDL
jgi:homoserine O-acetyltransferase/O-succinyltransferase